MTATEQKPAQTTATASAPRARKSRVGLVILMIAALLASGLARHWSSQQREEVNKSQRGALALTASGTSLNGMPSFATALLLGGLRGPLVMMLWTSSETQKQENNLQDIDTKIEWIRLLQPEFDAVHLFQIWNKAYNLSVKMTSLNNKYACIMDALDYARKVDAQKPNDINILSTVALTYSDKLGISQESYYYRYRIRRETQTLMRLSFPESLENKFRDAAIKLGWDEDQEPLSTSHRTNLISVLLEKPVAERLATILNDPGVSVNPENSHNIDSDAFSMRRMPHMLDVDGFITPALLAPRYPRPSDIPADQVYYDGSQLQSLAKYQPFTEGLSTFALSYANYERAYLLATQWNERPLQLSDMVIESRPAIILKQWARDEWERGRRAELRALGKTVPGNIDATRLEQMDDQIPPNSPIVEDLSLANAIDAYTLAARLYADSRIELLRFIGDFRSTVTNYYSHVDDTVAMEQLMLADRDYLQALSTTGDQRTALQHSSQFEYDKSLKQFCMIVLRYWTEEPVLNTVLPIDPQTHRRYARETIASMDPSLFVPTFDAAEKENHRRFTDPRTGQYYPAMDGYYDNRAEYLEYVARCRHRLAQLATLAQSPTTQP